MDRNLVNPQDYYQRVMSPSSRRAWIEIQKQAQRGANRQVALLAEGVDRNCKEREDRHIWAIKSPSSRRVQVEIDTKIW